MEQTYSSRKFLNKETKMAGKSVNKEWLANLRTIVLDRKAVEQSRPPCIYFEGATDKTSSQHRSSQPAINTTQPRFLIGKVLHIHRDYFVRHDYPLQDNQHVVFFIHSLRSSRTCNSRLRTHQDDQTSPLRRIHSQQLASRCRWL